MKKLILNKAIGCGKIWVNNTNEEIVNFFTMKLPCYDSGGTFCAV